MAFDAAGGIIYVSQGQNIFNASSIRKIVLATSTVTTVNGASGQHGVLLGPLPGGFNQGRRMAWIPGNGLAVSDNSEHAILLARGL